MTDKEKIFEILKTYVKKNGIMASTVILEEYAEELSKNGLVFSKELSDENERLKAVSEAELDTIHNLGEDYEKALEEINRLNERDKKNERIIELADKTIKAQSAEIERLRKETSQTIESIRKLARDTIRDGKWKTLYGWHISDLVIYDKPKELSEFHKAGYTETKESVSWLTREEENSWQIKRPPQSWSYVELLKGGAE